MGRHSKRYNSAREKLGDNGAMPVSAAVDAVKRGATAKFDETIECHIKLAVNPSKGEENVRGTVTLPHGTGRRVRVAVFAKGEAAAQAEEAGAHRVGAEDLVEAIEQGWSDFDVLVATPDVMRLVGRLGKRLGPRMPSSKAGNVTPDVGRAVKDLMAGKVEFKMDKGAVMHIPIGKASFPAEHLVQNFTALMSAIVRARPAAVKGRFIVSIALAPTMGPGVKVDVNEAMAGAVAA